MNNDWYFLGGRDLEMATIAALLRREKVRFSDRALAWGAGISAYAAELAVARAAGAVIVTVELPWDLAKTDSPRTDSPKTDLPRSNLPRSDQPDWNQQAVVEIDHHGARAGAAMASSLRQVFDRLGLPERRWSRRFALVAANDVGYLPAMQALGASVAEMRKIRALDRAAQGVTAAEEAEALRAIAQRQEFPGLCVLALAHDRASVAADFIEPLLGGPGCANLLILGRGEVNFYGAGKAVRALARKYPGGWLGGALPERGFWGHAGLLNADLLNAGALKRAQLLDYLRGFLK